MEETFIKFLENSDYPLGKVKSFFDCAQHEHEIPAKGAYLLFSGDETTWKYPKGESSIFYIGQSDNLPRRLISEHLKLANDVKSDTRKDYELYSAKYEFAAAFNAKYLTIETWQNMSSNKLEGWIFWEFIQKFGSLPLANGKADGNVWELLEK